jgi:diphthamide biosynthesis protein 7
LKSPARKFEPHAAGVLAILPIPESIIAPVTADSSQEERHILITGGYDDYVRVYGVSGEAKPAVLAELYVGHGVYKLKFIDDFHPSRTPTKTRYRALASCTNAGVRIFEFIRNENGSEDGEWSIDVLASVTQHRSLCYASDAMPLPPPEKMDENKSFEHEGSGSIQQSTVVASTSIYDKLLCIWAFRERDYTEEVDGTSKPRPHKDLILSEVPESDPVL